MATAHNKCKINQTKPTCLYQSKDGFQKIVSTGVDGKPFP
jgi:hypothetical protein